MMLIVAASAQPSLRPDTAGDLITVLTVLFFAMLVEVSRAVRERRPRKTFWNFALWAFPVVCTVGFLLAVYVLLYAVNFGPLHGELAQFIFDATGLYVIIFFIGLIVFGTVFRTRRDKVVSRVRPRIRPGRAMQRRRR